MDKLVKASTMSFFSVVIDALKITLKRLLESVTIVSVISFPRIRSRSYRSINPASNESANGYVSPAGTERNIRFYL